MEKTKLSIIMIVGVVVVCVFGVAVFLSLKDDKSGGDEDASSTSSVSSEGSNDSVEEVKKWSVGDKFTVADVTVTVKKAEEYVPTEDYYKADEGYRYFSILVTYENLSDVEIDYNPYDWYLYDTDGFRYESTSSGGHPQPLNNGRIAVGGNLASGYVTYLVPTDAVLTGLVVVPSLSDLNTIGKVAL